MSANTLPSVHVNLLQHVTEQIFQQLFAWMADSATGKIFRPKDILFQSTMTCYTYIWYQESIAERLFPI